MNLLITTLLPPAKLGYRILATLCDLSIIILLNCFIIGKWWLPTYHPDVVLQMRLLLETYAPQIQAGNFTAFIQQVSQSKELVDAFLVVDRILFFVTWLYYTLNAFYFKGGSLGKQIFDLQLFKLSTLRAPGKRDYILRAGLQTLCIFTLWSFLMCFNLCLMCLNPMRRGLQDWICNTYVVHYSAAERVREKLKQLAQKLNAPEEDAES